MDLIKIEASEKAFRYIEKSLVSSVADACPDVLVRVIFELGKPYCVNGDLSASESLHECALERVGDRHDFAGRFHLCSEVTLCVNELVERPLRELDRDVVERRLESCKCIACYGILYLVETVSQSDLCRNLCDRIAGRF